MPNSTPVETVYRLAYGLDDLSRSSVLALFKPDQTFTFDISAVLGEGGVSAKDITGEQFYEVACTRLGGFTSTQHLLGCPLVSYASETSAHVTVYVSAYHVVEEDEKAEGVTARVKWEMDLEAEKDAWFIRKYVVKRNVPFDYPAVFQRGHQRAQEGKLRMPKD